MRSFLVRWIVLTIAVGITTWLLPGIHIEGNFGLLVMISAVLGLLMTVLKPLLVLLTCPLVLLTLGLFGIVINTWLLYITAWFFPGSFQIDNFWWALLASVIISLISMGLNQILGEEE